jgi:hypothetical protein
MGQVRQVPKVIEAERFVLKDSAGKEQAHLGMDTLGPELKLDEVDAKHATFTSVRAGSMHMYRTGESNKDVSMIMGPGGIFFSTDEKDGEQKISMYAAGPTIELTDKQGFETTIGVTSLETVKTGESHKTSAASIVIFDKEKKAIWKAPLP